MSGKCKHILDLNTEEKRKFLDSFNIVVSDCDGVLWTISSSLPNSGKVINLLKNHGKQFKFMTNNCHWPDEKFIKKIESIGVEDTTKNDIILSVKGIAKHINNKYPGTQCHYLVSDIFYEGLFERGVNVLNVTPQREIELKDTKEAVISQECCALIVGVNINLTLVDFMKIHQYVERQDCPIFVSAVDTCLSVGENFSVIGPGDFLNVLWKNSEKKPIVCGKPSPIMTNYIVEEFNIDERKRYLFVGDNLVADIQFGCQSGFQTLFVLSGCHTKEEMLRRPIEYQPDYYADSMSDFLELFKDIEKCNGN